MTAYPTDRRPGLPMPGPESHAYPDADFPADPYPGAVPPFSFVHLDEQSHPLTFDVCWRTAGAELDLWLAGHGAPPLAARIPLLSYGSNRNPSKITWLRRALGLAGPVVVLRARTQGLAAVWASGFRARDGQRTSVLGAAPGASEQHAVWMATPDQVAVLDRCEGRGDRYRLARLGAGAVHTDDGPSEAWVYIDHRVDPGPPRPGYLERIVDGAMHHGLPHRWIEFLRRWDPAHWPMRVNKSGSPAPQSLTELLANPGVIEESSLRSRFGFLAIHGGGLEQMTDVIAERAADAAGASVYALRHPDHYPHHPVHFR